MKPCKYLDYDESHYPQCKLIFLEDQGFPGVRYWDRSNFITESELRTFPNTPIKVQFCCKGRGRINGIFQCYNPGEMSCYELEQKEEIHDRKAAKAVK